MEVHAIAATDLSHLYLLVALCHLGTLLSGKVRRRGVTHHFLRHVLVAARTLVRVPQLLVHRILVVRVLRAA